ncbi:MAG: DUF6498-containing protein [Alphaproteobacteria bacterium]
MSLRLRDALLILFNLFPLALVIDGAWRPFDVMAFYWLELAAVGVFALLGLVMAAFYDFYRKKTAAAVGYLLTAVFFPLHFGFFLVVLCFPVGSFLAEEASSVTLTGPLVPMFAVIDNMNFWAVLPVVFAWQLFVFITDFVLPRRFAQEHPEILGSAYKNLFVFFISAFFGVAIGMQTGELFWGAVILCVLKTVIAYAVSKNKPAESTAV